MQLKASAYMKVMVELQNLRITGKNAIKKQVLT
jgi:hypothetical protein